MIEDLGGQHVLHSKGVQDPANPTNPTKWIDGKCPLKLQAVSHNHQLGEAR